MQGADAPIASSSIRSTAPPISCTAFRSLPSRSRWSATASSSRASSTIRRATRPSPPRTGKGAFLNDRRLRVAARTELADCVMATGIPHRGRPSHDSFCGKLSAVMARYRRRPAHGRRGARSCLDRGGPLRRLWEQNLRAWDLAAGIVILREAGGFVSDADGRGHMLDKGSVVAGNEADPPQAIEAAQDGRRRARGSRDHHAIILMGATSGRRKSDAPNSLARPEVAVLPAILFG